ncbi:MAG: hypothetical protein JNN08_19585 [Bryobacterales bacterium]|nr:hypothetical protein [Bryobacterales bacterium]
MLKLADAVKYFRDHEGVVSHMYLDIVGLVTVGVGFLLRNAEDAVALKFVNRATGKPATAEEKRRDWTAVNQQEKARRADFYKKFTQLDLPADQIDKRLEALIGEFSSSLRSRFPKFDAFPPTAQIGLLDMIYSLGPSGFFKGYPKMCGAVDRQDWAAAGAECERGGVSPSRNKDCRQLFLDAVTVPVESVAFAPVKKKGKKTTKAARG